MSGVNILTNRIYDQINGFRRDNAALSDLQWNLSILEKEGPKHRDLYNEVVGQIYDLVEEGILDADDLYQFLEEE